MELKTDQKFLNLTIDGVVHPLKMPKLKHQLIVDEMIEASREGKPETKIIIRLLTEMGLPEAVCLELEETDFYAILRAIGQAKKTS
jgi:hypothetical protein